MVSHQLRCFKLPPLFSSACKIMSVFLWVTWLLSLLGTNQNKQETPYHTCERNRAHFETFRVGFKFSTGCREVLGMEVMFYRWLERVSVWNSWFIEKMCKEMFSKMGQWHPCKWCTIYRSHFRTNGDFQLVLDAGEMQLYRFQSGCRSAAVTPLFERVIALQKWDSTVRRTLV